MKLRITLNGTPRMLFTEPGESVQQMLQKAGVYSVRKSEERRGFAGSDIILLNGKVVCSELLVAAQVEGQKIMTVEGLSPDGTMSPVQSALVDAGVVQSAYNSPATALVLTELLDRVPEPSREDIIDALSCIYIRDSGYQQYFKAVEIAVKRRKDPNYTTQIAEEFRDDLRVIGKTSRKIDGPQLVMGKRAFVEDMVLPGSLILRMLRSPHPHAYIKNIKTQEAEE
ncbi:molybdopterin-dependent oxidoreductase Mo/Fe-S-binding subunit, partial [bacterium]|nr:molybdopterin-dependent oxidoreductase Mo/Fe-S-binding subunit [bacterium]